MRGDAFEASALLRRCDASLQAGTRKGSGWRGHARGGGCVDAASGFEPEESPFYSKGLLDFWGKRVKGWPPAMQIAKKDNACAFDPE